MFHSRLQQAEPRSLKSPFHNLSLHFRFANGIAKAILRMSIAVVINGRAIHKIGFAIQPYRQVAAFAFEAKPALTAGGFHHLRFSGTIRLRRLLSLQRRGYKY